MNNITKLILSIFLFCFGFFSYAANTSFWSHSALSFFTKDDWRLSKEARNDALNNYKDGHILSWTNPKTGTHGTFAPYHTTYEHGELCRNLKMMSTARLVHEKTIFRFCRQQNEWKIM